MSTKQPVHVEDIFSAFGDLFGELFGASPHLAVTLELTDEEAAAGVTREVAVTRRLACATCAGRGTTAAADTATETCTACGGKGRRIATQGFFQIATTCAPCHGRGKLVGSPCDDCGGAGARAVPATVTVEVPAGAAHEQTLKVPGAGTRQGDVVGDLHVYLLVGGRPDSRLAAFEPPPAELPRATIHRGAAVPRRPPIAIAVGIVLAILAVLALLVR